jgi:hypothetical protein
MFAAFAYRLPLFLAAAAMTQRTTPLSVKNDRGLRQAF